MQNTNMQLVKSTTQQKPKALEVFASRLSMEPSIVMNTLKQTVFKNASNEELAALVVVANEYNLNPFLKEIYAFPAKGGGIVPVVSIDGWNKMMIRQPDFDGIEFEFQDSEDGKPFACTATVYVKGRSRPVKVTEYFEECFRSTDPWKQMPRRMLRHKALIQASRVAFGFSGIHDEDEGSDFRATTVVEVEQPAPVKRKMIAEPKQDVYAEFMSFMGENGFTFEDVRTWGGESGNIENADSIASISEVPADVLARLLRAKDSLAQSINSTKAAKGGAQ